METLYKWQDLIGAIIGASAPFILWWFVEKYRQYRNKKERLYYMHRIIVDQINSILEAKRTILAFIKYKLDFLIDTPRAETESQYSVDLTFFPLFAVTALSDDIHREATGSVYVDNKLAQSYKISKDLPFVIDDLRKQFHETLNFNREIAFNKLNPAATQRMTYLDHLRQYKAVLKDEMLGQNIPITLKVLTETLVAIIEFGKVSTMRWRFRFEGHCKFFRNKKEFEQYRKDTYERIEKKFGQEVKRQLEIFNSTL